MRASLSALLFTAFPILPLAGQSPSVAIETLVAEIATQHPEIAFYEAAIAAADADARAATAVQPPELSIELGKKRVRDAAGPLAGEGLAWSVSLSQTFEWPGRLALRKAVAQRDVMLAETGLEQFRTALQARARVLAYGLHATATKATALREVADRFATLKETFLAREPGGLTPLLEIRVLEAQELALQRRASDADLAAQAALIEIIQLRGCEPDAPLRVVPPAITFGDAPELARLLDAARANNFEFRARQIELEQQGFVVRLARHERYPSVTVSPFLERESADGRETTAGVGISLPLPVVRANRASVEAAEARRQQAEAAMRAAQRDLEREVTIAAQAFSAKVAELHRWPPGALDTFREAAAAADRHYRLGAVPLSTYVELQGAYLDAVETLLETEAEALEAGLRLQQLTGLEFGAVRLVP